MARLQARSGARSFATRFWTASSQTTLYVFSLSTVLRQTDVTASCMDEEIVVERAMKSCAQCHGKLGLGVRARNLWNGHWWVHVRFCRHIVRLFTSWNGTTPKHFPGAPFWFAAVPATDRPRQASVGIPPSPRCD